MPAKKAEKKEEETPKKRVKPVVEEIVEETETPKTEEVVEETPAEESASEKEGGVSIEPDFSSSSSSENTTADSTEPETTDTSDTTNETPIETTETIKEENTEVPAETASPAVETDKKMSFKTVLFTTVISALVAAFVSGGVYVYLSSRDASDEAMEKIVATEEATPEPTTVPTATPAPQDETDLTEFSVQVLNGSGKIGAAGKGSDSAESAGFVVDNTGNADNYDYEESVVQAKEDVPQSAVDKLVTALEDDGYKVKIGKDLASSNKYDIVIIVGSSSN